MGRTNGLAAACILALTGSVIGCSSCARSHAALENKIARAEELRQKGDLEGTERELQAALLVDNKSVAALSLLAMTRFARKNPAGAAESARAWVLVEPESAAAHNDLGYYLLEAGAVESAISELELATKLDPRMELARNNLAVARARVRPPQEHREPSAPANGGRDSALDRLAAGLRFHAEGNLKAAIEATRESERLDPQLALAPNNLGYFLFEAGDLQNAARELHRALSLDPSLEIARNNLAVVEQRLRSGER
jgi:Flp pilus assembly protein TadD